MTSNFKLTINKIKKYLPLLIIIFYAFLVSIPFSAVTGDGEVFNSLKGNIFSILQNRYHEWTSRLIIEGIFIEILRISSYLWNVLNIAMICLLYYSIKKITNIKNNIFIDYVIALLMIVYSYFEMSSAGWGATTVNYLWVVSLGLYSLLPIIYELRDEKYNHKIYFLTIPALLYSANQEQAAALLFGFLLIFNIYNYLKNKKINIVMLMYLFIALAGIIFSLTCPGNNNRLLVETPIWFKDFNSLNIIEKILLSLNNTFDLFLSKYNYIFIALYTLLTYISYKKNNRILLLISGILTIGTLVIPFLDIFNLNEIYKVSHIDNHNIIGILNLNSLSYIFSIIISLLYFILTPIIIYFICKEKELKYILSIVFIAGVLSRIIIGFSPTLFASSYRTGIFMNYLILIIIPILLSYVDLTKKDEKNIIIILVSIVFIKILLILVAQHKRIINLVHKFI